MSRRWEPDSSLLAVLDEQGSGPDRLGEVLLRPFQENRNRGIIGTAANVPDRIAAEVGRWFYTGLLAGATVGEALHGAKWRLLRDRGNPLGLLYCLHACAQMRIAPLPPPARIERETSAGRPG